MRFKSAVIIGRFQPVHCGHLKIINEALENSEHLFIIVGSANKPRQLRNPFLISERIEMIKGAVDSSLHDRIHFIEVRDYFYNNNGWVNEVTQKVKTAQAHLKIRNENTTLMGFEKDHTSSYLSWFPHWDRYDFKDNFEGINATAIREDYLRHSDKIKKDPRVARSTQEWLSNFATTEEYLKLNEEQKMIDEYKISWATAPFPPVFVTADSLLVCAEHILLIKRKHNPGKDLWAIPGGFLDPHELISECAIRELKEETCVQVSTESLRESLTDVQIFDHPLRSSRGRTVTHVHLFKLEDLSLPNIEANDDAAEAQWVPLLDIGKMENIFFEDHFYIINRMV